MEIKKIQKLKNNRYKIVLENQEIINTYDDVILNNNLLFKKNIDSKMLNEINNQTLYYDCYNRTIKFIEKKLRSEKEVNEYLEKIIPENFEYKDRIINKLKKINLINDENYVKAYISDRMLLSTDGPNKIKQELTKYYIDENIIEENISKIEENKVYEKCKKIIDKKIKSNSKYSNYILSQKIMSDLLNKGYELEMIKQILNQDIKKNDSILEKEYFKIFNKLSKKYEGDKLYFEIRNKLYQKGFSLDEINNLLKTID